MTIESERGITCDVCKQVKCHHHYPEGIPEYCLATRFHDLLEQTKGEYITPEVVDIYITSGKVVTKGYMKWTRIQEAIEFAKELGITKIGFATCVGLIRESWDISELFKGAGFTVICAACQIGRVHPRERGLPEEYSNLLGLHCNPIAQAEILNYEETELNFIIGLCLGHDILFNRYSKAPVSTLIVKDRVTGNNPSAAINSFFHRRSLFKEYCGRDII